MRAGFGPFAAMVLALGALVSADPAEAATGPAMMWQEAAERCFDAVDEGAPIAAGNFAAQLALEEGELWPRQIFRSDSMEIWQSSIDAGGALMARSCEVRHLEYLDLGAVADITGAYTDLSGDWIDRGYEVQPKGRRLNVLAGMLSELRSTSPNPRGCAVAVSFLSAPAQGLVLFSVSEMARQPCGSRPREIE
ncbi:MAG: hypothetical protein P1U53_06060 [Sulfitobacter sp.]|nr:hypothetical protein [Sulfitobacter sp.]